MSSLNGKRLWQEFRERWRNEGRQRFFRFDVEFDGQEPALDDTTRFQELKSVTQSQLSHSSELDNLARCLVASLFYFEFESNPRYTEGRMSCAGHIMCRLEGRGASLTALIRQLSSCAARFQVQEQTISEPIDHRSFIGTEGEFRKRIEFQVNGRQDKISIRVAEGGATSYNISGSPFTIHSLAKAQGIDSMFGRTDHRKRGVLDGARLPESKRQRARC